MPRCLDAADPLSENAKALPYRCPTPCRPFAFVQYFSAVLTDPLAQTAMTVLLFLVNRPYLVGILPVRVPPPPSSSLNG